jgi:hypothetical protein
VSVISRRLASQDDILSLSNSFNFFIHLRCPWRFFRPD